MCTTVNGPCSSEICVDWLVLQKTLMVECVSWFGIVQSLTVNEGIQGARLNGDEKKDSSRDTQSLVFPYTH